MGRLSDHALLEHPSLFTGARQPIGYPDGIPVEVCTLFEKLALDVHTSGIARYSADAILHRIRWSFHIERGNRGFKADNCWTAPLARWFLKRHPDLPGFFELRTKKQGDE